MDEPVGYTVTLQGQTFQVGDLLESAKSAEIIQVPLAELEIYLHDDSWGHCLPISFLTADSSTCCRDHESRIADANISFPLLFNQEHDLLDGTHRIVKGFRSGVDSLPARVITNMPNPIRDDLRQKYELTHEDLCSLLVQLHGTTVPPSIVIDLIGISAGTKLLGRTVIFDESLATMVKAALSSRGLQVSAFNQIVYFGVDSEIVKCGIEVDNATMPHAFRMGGLLGYPPCCSLKAAEIGEGSLDCYSDEVSSRIRRGSGFMSILPAGYVDGRSCISHVPCSFDCKSSLAIAERNLEIMHSESVRELLERYGFPLF